jgi:hypothetical protein
VHTYIDLCFSPDSLSSVELAQRIREGTGLEFIIGPHDLVFEWATIDEFHEVLGKLHNALKGSGVHYRVQTVGDEPTYVQPMPWPPAAHRDGPALHPAYHARA